MPNPAPGGDAYRAVARLIDGIRRTESDLARRLPPAWVAAHGPRYQRLKEGLIDVRFAWEECVRLWAGMNRAVGSRKTDLPDVAEALMAVAIACAKLSVDVDAIAVRVPEAPA